MYFSGFTTTLLTAAVWWWWSWWSPCVRGAGFDVTVAIATNIGSIQGAPGCVAIVHCGASGVSFPTIREGEHTVPDLLSSALKISKKKNYFESIVVIHYFKLQYCDHSKHSRKTKDCNRDVLSDLNDYSLNFKVLPRCVIVEGTVKIYKINSPCMCVKDNSGQYSSMLSCWIIPRWRERIRATKVMLLAI